jgi:hypothetical protein
MDMFTYVWDAMITERARVNGELETLKAQLDAGLTVIQQTEANLPLAVDGMAMPEIRWCTNGRKDGEGAGNGTGVYVYYNPSDNTWKRFSDDSTVAT